VIKDRKYVILGFKQEPGLIYITGLGFPKINLRCKYPQDPAKPISIPLTGLIYITGLGFPRVSLTSPSHICLSLEGSSLSSLYTLTAGRGQGQGSRAHACAGGGTHHYGRTQICRVPPALPSAKNRALGEATLCRVPDRVTLGKV
jgi:hypothetical protein